MNAERWDLIREIIDSLLDMPTELRAAALVAACGHDPGLLRQVQQMFDAAGQIGEDEFEALLAARRTAERAVQPREEAPLRPGDVVGNYRIESVIDRGGDGLLYKAIDQRLRRFVVLKEVGVQSATGLRRRRFEREKDALSRLQHPAVVRIYDFVEDDGRCFIVTEFLDGIPLPTVLPTDVGKLEVSLALVSAVQAVHDVGLVHNDIKPENVILTRDRRVVLVDLGIAEEIEGEGRTTTLRGTLPYLAPERCLGEPPSRASDVHSLGLVLYGVWAGSRPYAGCDKAETLFRKMMEVLPREPLAQRGTPEELVHLILDMTATRPAERPTMDNVVARLSVIRGLPLPRRDWRRQATLAASLALVLVLPGLAWRWFTAVNDGRARVVLADAHGARVDETDVVSVPLPTPDWRRDKNRPTATFDQTVSPLKGDRDAETSASVVSDLRPRGTDATIVPPHPTVSASPPTPPVAPDPQPASNEAVPSSVTSRGPGDGLDSGRRDQNAFVQGPALTVAPVEVDSPIPSPTISLAEPPSLRCHALRAAVRDVLDKIEMAYRERSVHKIAGVFPTLNPAELKDIGTSFAESKEYDYRWDKEGAVVELSPTCGDSPPTSARIRAERTIRITPRVGRSKTTRSYFTVDVERRGGEWAIVSIARS